MSGAFNELSSAELERLAILSEELGEAQQAIGKILRHGYENTHPEGGWTNRTSLENELGDVVYAINLLCHTGDLSRKEISHHRLQKERSIKPFLHHQGVKP